MGCSLRAIEDLAAELYLHEPPVHFAVSMASLMHHPPVLKPLTKYFVRLETNISIREGLLCNKHLLLILTPIFHKQKMPWMVLIMEDLEESTFRLRSHSIEAGLESGEEFVDILRSNSDVDMEADAMECVRILNVG